MSVDAWLAIGGGLVLAGLPGTGLSASPPAAASTLAVSRYGDPLALAPALVTKTIARTSAVLVEVRTDDGAVVLSTPEHPFAARSLGQDRAGWARADSLAVGDHLIRLSPDGPTTEVTSVKSRHGRPIPVFNLVVSRIHAYAVGSDHLLVHNGKCKTPEEIAADHQRLEDLVAERTRLKKDGDPENKLADIGKQIKRLQEMFRISAMRARTKADPVRYEAYRARVRDHATRFEQNHPGKRLADRKAKYQHRTDEVRERERRRKAERYRSDEDYRRRVNQRGRDWRRRQAIIASLGKSVESYGRDRSLKGVSTEAIDAEVRELRALLRGPGESAEPDTTELRQAVEEDFGDLERQLESGAGGEAATTSSLERDFGLEERTFEESLAEVHDRISEYDSMSEEIAAFFPGMRDELVAEERNLVNRRCAQLQSEMEVTKHQLMLMRDIPEFHDAAAEGALEHQLETLTTELGTLTGAPP